MINKKAYQLSSAILSTFAVAILMGEFSPVKAQANQSDEFFEEGREEFERQAETLGDPENSFSQPQLTIEEDPSIGEESPSPNEELGLDENLPDQPDNEQIKLRL